GPFSVKPLIRGLGFQRIVVLDDGQRQESQSWDDDDSPALDGSNANRIEIVKGPQSVLYGPDALGGVINVVSRVRTALGEAMPLHGSPQVQFLSSTRQVGSHLQLDGGLPTLSYGGDATARSAGDQQTPAGSLPNTGAKEFDAGGYVQSALAAGVILVDY